MTWQRPGLTAPSTSFGLVLTSSCQPSMSASAHQVCVRSNSKWCVPPATCLACAHAVGCGWAGRADSIVRDAERVRQALVPGDSCGGKMAILGQSFGGFCCLSYLSFAPEGARTSKFRFLPVVGRREGVRVQPFPVLVRLCQILRSQPACSYSL